MVLAALGGGAHSLLVLLAILWIVGIVGWVIHDYNGN